MTRINLTLTSLITILAATLIPAGHVFSQNLPPGPKVVYQSKLPVSGLSGEFDLVSRIVEFAPGSATPSHTHGGPVLTTVLEGEMSNAVEGKAEQIVKTGESWAELPGEYAVVGNKGTTKARVSVLFAIPKGAAFTTPKGGTPTANLPPGPTLVYSSTLPGITVPGDFELTNLIMDFAPGSATPSHTHGGPGIVTVLEGQISNAVEGKAEQIVRTGESWAELPGEYAVVGNKGTANARVSFVVALPKGALLTTVKQAATATAVPQPPAPVVEETPVPVVQPVGMPSTGSGGMDMLLPLVLLALFCLVVGGSKLVRPTTER